MAFVALIRPPSLFSRSAVTLNATPPISLAYLAGSLTVAGHHVQIIDAVGEAIEQIYPAGLGELLANGLTHQEIIERLDPRAEFIGISCLFTHEWPNIRRLARAIREARPGALIVCGGEHITAEPEYSLSDCEAVDCAVVGEGEETIVDLVRAVGSGAGFGGVPGLVYRNGREVVLAPSRQRIRAIDEIPRPRWDLTPLRTYLDKGYSFGVNRGRTIPMLATRGCPYQCTFCSSPQMWTTQWFARKPELVIAEIEDYIREYGVENIDFYDLTAVVKKEWIADFCRLLTAADLGITWQLPSGTRSEAIDAEVAQLLYRSGCTNLSYAPESGSPRILKRIKKKVQLDRMLDSMREAVGSGLNVKANIILGFPEETHLDVWKSFSFIARTALAGLNDISIWIYSPYPGCELFKELRAQGRIKSFDDRYFIALLSYADLKNVVSWDDKLPARTLKFYRIFGMLLFYGMSYLSNPLRFFRTVRNLLRQKHESRMEMALGAFLKRLRFSADRVNPLGRTS
ncbi:MAG: B12-binding domain-containing radical SAM protein [Deltaproteobacteria bacterium]|nr:B12-binding domain-containing radical SAM protein [Deltaproteobacteria bacterium]